MTYFVYGVFVMDELIVCADAGAPFARIKLHKRKLLFSSALQTSRYFTRTLFRSKLRGELRYEAVENKIMNRLKAFGRLREITSR